MTKTRVLLADDHALVRAGIRALLQNLTQIEVVGEADDGGEVIRLIGELHPDVVLMDIAMPGLNGLEAIVQVSQKFPTVRVIILSMHADEEYVLQALSAGVAGYLLKGARLSELELALSSAMQGETYLSPAVSKYVVSGYIQRSDASKMHNEAEMHQTKALTPRQRETLQLIVKGATTKEIAQKLNISVKTVEMHRSQLMERLNIHDIAGLVRYAIRTGMITSND